MKANKKNILKMPNAKEAEKQQRAAVEELKPLEPYKDENSSEKKKWTWPTDGKFKTYYEFWMLIHNIYYVFIVVLRIAFEDKPAYIMVNIDWYMNAVFLFDIIRHFTEPFMRDSRLEMNRKKIARNYLLGWFIFDLYSFFPLALLRYNSKWEDGGKDNVKNLLELNFSRLPRLYQIMLFMQLGRGRETGRFIGEFLKWTEFRIEY